MRRLCGDGGKATDAEVLLCRENAPGGPVLTMQVLYQLSYVGADDES